MDNFLTDLDTGKFDPDFHEPEPEAASPVKESSANGVSALNGTDTSAQADEDVKPTGNGEDDMQFNVEAEDEEEDGEDLFADDALEA